MKYEIYSGSRLILPADDVRQIYHGSHLIWERTSGPQGLVIERVADLPDSYLRFTRGGVLAPSYISDETIKPFYDLQGNAHTVDFSGLLTAPDTITVSKISYELTSISGRFVLSDTTLYYVTATYKNYDYDREIKRVLGYVECDAGKVADFRLWTVSPLLTDTKQQWSTYTDPKGGGDYSGNYLYLQQRPTHIVRGAGSGIYPLNRPLGGLSGQDGISQLSYVKEGGIVTDAGYYVLAVCGENLVCAEDISIKTGDIKGKITLRNLQGESPQTVIDSYTVGSFTDPENDRHLDEPVFQSHFNYTGGQLFYYAKNGKGNQIIAGPAFNAVPENIGYTNETFFAIDKDNSDILRYSAPGTGWTTATVKDTSGVRYALEGGWTDGGLYAGTDGWCYMIGKTGVSTDARYALLRAKYYH